VKQQDLGGGAAERTSEVCVIRSSGGGTKVMSAKTK
jgi:hypothetical protein